MYEDVYGKKCIMFIDNKRYMSNSKYQKISCDGPLHGPFSVILSVIPLYFFYFFLTVTKPFLLVSWNLGLHKLLLSPTVLASLLIARVLYSHCLFRTRRWAWILHLGSDILLWLQLLCFLNPSQL